MGKKRTEINGNKSQFSILSFFHFFFFFYLRGYVIGTRGDLPGVKVTPTAFEDVDTAPEDFVEGMGTGDALEIASLYNAQLKISTSCHMRY
jgi:hypothetical protein